MSAIIRATLMSIEASLMSLLSPIFLLVIFLVYTQYKRGSALERAFLGLEKTKLSMKVAKSIVVGIMGGIVATIVIVGLGVSVQLEGFFYLWPVAISLMFINPRYICFSYAGGLISLFSLITGFPKVDVTGLMAIVGVLHLTESFLIFVDGDSTTSPAFMENKKYGVIGTHIMQRFWPIPFVVLITSAGLPEGGGVSMPDWWPILNPLRETTEATVFNILPIVAALGYGDMAFSTMPKEKVRASAIRLFGYSVILLVLVVLSSYIYAFKYIAAIFAPVAHELLIVLSNKLEKGKKPIFRRRDFGVTVLDVKPGGPAQKMGIQPGDVIMSINGKLVYDENSITDILMDFPTYIWIDVMDYKGKKVSYDYKQYPYGLNSIGILYVPGNNANVHVISERKSLVARLMGKFMKRK